MKCPLHYKIVGYNGTAQILDYFTCLKGECAWWDDGAPGCSVLSIAQELATIRQKGELENEAKTR